MKLSILNRLLLVLLAMTALFGEMFLRLWNVEQDRREQHMQEQTEMHRRVFEHACELEEQTWLQLLQDITREIGSAWPDHDATLGHLKKRLAERPDLQGCWILDAGGKRVFEASKGGDIGAGFSIDMPKLLDRLDEESAVHFYHLDGERLFEVAATAIPGRAPISVLAIVRHFEKRQTVRIEQLSRLEVKIAAAGAEQPPSEISVELKGLDGKPVSRLTGALTKSELGTSFETQKKQWLNLVFIILGFFVVVALLVWLWVGSESLARGGAGKILELSRGNSELGPFATMLAKFRREQEKLAEEMKALQAAEAATREREELFRSIFHQAEQLIIQLKPTGEVIRVNSVATTLSGGKVDWIGHSIENAPIWKNRERAARRFEEALATAQSGATAQFELEVRDGSGEPLQFGLFLKPVYRDEEQKELLLLLLEGNDLSSFRKMEADVIRAGEEERGRIGLDLHDGLCQELTAADCCLKLAEVRLGKGDASGLSDLTAARGMLTNAMSGARDLARLLSPPVLAQKGLASSLEELAMNARRMFGVACDVRVGKAISCEEEVAKHLYRIAQEGIQNSIRHGQATRIEIDLIGGDSGLILEIADDGSGVPAETLKKWNLSRDHGLKTIRYRVQLIGGTLTIKANEPHGLIVTCHVPND